VVRRRDAIFEGVIHHSTAAAAMRVCLTSDRPLRRLTVLATAEDFLLHRPGILGRTSRVKRIVHAIRAICAALFNLVVERINRSWIKVIGMAPPSWSRARSAWAPRSR